MDLSRSTRISSPSSSSEDNDKFIQVNLAAVRPYVTCPICLGILKNTKTSMECLHRFCKECIDKAIRLGSKECPTCREHLASHRSLRNDLRFDLIITTLYPDIDKYEEEESALQDEEIRRNRKLQASIAKIQKRQMEATKGKQKLFRNDNSEDVSDSPGLAVRRRERSVASGDGRIPKDLCWGSGGSRSQLRSASARGSQITMPVVNNGIGDNNDEMDIQLALAPLDEQTIPSLDQPYICCSPGCSVRQLSKFVAHKIGLEPEELEIVFVKGPKSGLRILGERETLAALRSSCISSEGHLVLAYRFKFDLGSS